MASCCDNVRDLLTSVNDPNKHIRMAYVGRLDAFVEVVRMLCLWVSCASPWGSPDRRSVPRVLLGKSGWGWSGWECVSRVTRRCVPRGIRGRGSPQKGHHATNRLKRLKRPGEKIGISFVRSCVNAYFKLKRSLHMPIAILIKGWGTTFAVYTIMTFLGFMYWNLPPTFSQLEMKAKFLGCSFSSMFVFNFFFCSCFKFSYGCRSFQICIFILFLYFWSDVIWNFISLSWNEMIYGYWISISFLFVFI